GENVALGQLYDNAELAAHGEKSGYGSYTGSGFQHLYNVRTLRSGEWLAEFKHEKNPQAMLRIRTFAEPQAKIMVADAHVSPVNFPQVIRSLVARKTGDTPLLASQFASVIEPFESDQPLIRRAKAIQIGADHGLELQITLADGSIDVVRYNFEQAKA